MVAIDIQAVCLATLGILLNSLILITFFRDQGKGKTFTACDQILLSMAFTSIVIEFSVITHNVISFLELCNMRNEDRFISININYIILAVMVDFSFWQTALLSSYYCAKLCNMSHCFLRWMNRMLSSSTIFLLLGSAAFCFLINVSFFWDLQLGSPENATQPVKRINVWELSISYYILNLMLGCCLPFLFNFTFISLSIRSILKHVQQLKKNVAQCGSSSLIGGPVQAVSTMVLCVMLDLIYFVDFVGQVLSNFNNGITVNIIAWVTFIVYPIIRPSLLIIRNPQLKRRIGGMCFHS